MMVNLWPFANSTNVRSYNLMTAMDGVPDIFDIRYERDRNLDSIEEFNKYAGEYGTFVSREFPYFYNAYQVYQADPTQHHYKVLNHMNLTYDSVSVLYPQLMYESILRYATQDKEFEYNLKVTPYPIIHSARMSTRAIYTSTLILILGIALSLIASLVVSHVVEERLSNLFLQE